MSTVFTFLLSSTPLFLLGWLLFFSLLIALNLISQLSHTFSGFLLVLLITGGVLILFSYVVATMPNFKEGKKKRSKSFLITLTGLILLVRLFFGGERGKSANLSPETSLSEVYLAFSPGVLGGLFVLITLAFILITLVLKVPRDFLRKF